MFYREAIESDTLELLKKINSNSYFKNVRLVGWMALALQTGHRKSVDLDFFGSFYPDEYEVSKAIQTYGDIKKLHSTPNIFVFSINNIKVDFVNYSYPWIEDIMYINGLKLAGKKDIGAMKLAAIAGRGTKKDFVDLYFLLKEFSLKELRDFYSQKYNDGNIFMVLRSLNYFEDADKDDIQMIKNVSWEDIKNNITEQHKEFLS